MLRFTEDHEWLKLDGDVATVGITPFATTQLGDIVFIDLPEVGKRLKKGDPAAVVESVKAASDVYAPLDGEVIEVNAAVSDDPASVNADASAAWFFKLKLSDPASADALMDDAAYAAMTA